MGGTCLQSLALYLIMDHDCYRWQDANCPDICRFLQSTSEATSNITPIQWTENAQSTLVVLDARNHQQSGTKWNSE